MIRLIYLHQYFVRPEQGGGTRSFEFARRLAHSGFDIHVVTSDRTRSTAAWTTDTVSGFTVHSIGIPYSNKMTYRQRVVAFARFALSASKHARRLKPDIVFATSTPLTIGIPALWAIAFRSAPMVFEVRDLWPEMPIAVGALSSKPAVTLARWLERTVYRRSTRIVALSPGMRDGIVSTGYDTSRVAVIPNACDIDMFTVAESETTAWLNQHAYLKNRRFVLYAGTIGRINGVSYLVDVAARAMALNSTLQFVVIGDGAEAQAISQRAADAGVLNVNFFLLPHTNKRDVACALSACALASSLFLPIPAMEANSANKFFDALAAGRPVALNYGGWQMELLHQWDAGIQLPRDPAHAAQLLIQATNDPAHLELMGRNARELGRTHFDRDQLACELTNVLMRALADARQRTPTPHIGPHD